MILVAIACLLLGVGVGSLLTIVVIRTLTVAPPGDTSAITRMARAVLRRNPDREGMIQNTEDDVFGGTTR